MRGGSLGEIRHHDPGELLQAAHDLTAIAELVVVPDVEHRVVTLDDRRRSIDDPACSVSVVLELDRIHSDFLCSSYSKYSEKNAFKSMKNEQPARNWTRKV